MHLFSRSKWYVRSNSKLKQHFSLYLHVNSSSKTEKKSSYNGIGYVNNIYDVAGEEAINTSFLLDFREIIYLYYLQVEVVVNLEYMLIFVSWKEDPQRKRVFYQMIQLNRPIFYSSYMFGHFQE